MKELGGPDLPGIGFALGMERLVMTDPAPLEAEPRCDGLPGPAGAGRRSTTPCACSASCARPGLRVLMDHEGRGLKSQMKRADKLGARFVAILGEDELAQGAWTVRDMKASTQEAGRPGRALAAHLIEKTTRWLRRWAT